MNVEMRDGLPSRHSNDDADVVAVRRLLGLDGFARNVHEFQEFVLLVTSRVEQAGTRR